VRMAVLFTALTLNDDRDHAIQGLTKEAAQ
jgi:hypothetical protein